MAHKRKCGWYQRCTVKKKHAKPTTTKTKVKAQQEMPGVTLNQNTASDFQRANNTPDYNFGGINMRGFSLDAVNRGLQQRQVGYAVPGGGTLYFTADRAQPAAKKQKTGKQEEKEQAEFVKPPLPKGPMPPPGAMPDTARRRAYYAYAAELAAAEAARRDMDPSAAGSGSTSSVVRGGGAQNAAERQRVASGGRGTHRMFAEGSPSELSPEPPPPGTDVFQPADPAEYDQDDLIPHDRSGDVARADDPQYFQQGGEDGGVEEQKGEINLQEQKENDPPRPPSPPPLPPANRPRFHRGRQPAAPEPQLQAVEEGKEGEGPVPDEPPVVQEWLDHTLMNDIFEPLDERRRAERVRRNVTGPPAFQLGQEVSGAALVSQNVAPRSHARRRILAGAGAGPNNLAVLAAAGGAMAHGYSPVTGPPLPLRDQDRNVREGNALFDAALQPHRQADGSLSPTRINHPRASSPLFQGLRGLFEPAVKVYPNSN